MELAAVVPPPPPATDNDNLPKDFQDALSIIFDKGAGKPNETTAPVESTPAANAAETVHDIQHVVMQDDSSSFVQMDISPMHSQAEHDQNTVAMGAANMDIEEQSQYALLYGDEQQHYMTNQVQQQPLAESQQIDLGTQSIPTPPINVIDGDGRLTQIPGPVLEVGSDFVMLDSDGNRIEHYPIVPNASSGVDMAGMQEHNHELELKNKRKQQELDDLAMLGIDADDLAAQCI